VNPFATLGVTTDAPENVIRAAYKARIRDVHPDNGGTAEEAQHVNEAWRVLSDPELRAQARAAAERNAEPKPETKTSRPAAAPRTEPPAAPQVYRGAINPPGPLWKALPVLVSVALAVGLGVWAGCTDIVLVLPICFMVAGFALMFARTFASIVCVAAAIGAVSLRGTALFATFPPPHPGSQAVGFCFVGAAAISIAVTALTQWRQQVRWSTYIGSCVLATANQRGVGLYEVLASDTVSDNRYLMLLRHIDTGREVERTLVTPPLFRGELIVLADDGFRPLVHAAPVDVANARKAMKA
jgi:hypothetical protein